MGVGMPIGVCGTPIGTGMLMAVNAGGVPDPIGLGVRVPTLIEAEACKPGAAGVRNDQGIGPQRV